MAQLEPGAIDERLTRIRDTISGDSIRTQMEATLDPLGLFARAMKPFSSSSSMDQGSALASEDGLFQIALIITNQPGLDARSCQAVMEQVNQFRDRMLSEWTGYKPKVYVTGRTAFVAQISRSMEGDVYSECDPVHLYRQRAVLPGFSPFSAIDRDRFDPVLVGDRCAGAWDADFSSAQRGCDRIFLDPGRCRS